LNIRPEKKAIKGEGGGGRLGRKRGLGIRSGEYLVNWREQLGGGIVGKGSAKFNCYVSVRGSSYHATSKKWWVEKRNQSSLELTRLSTEQNVNLEKNKHGSMRNIM